MTILRKIISAPYTSLKLSSQLIATKQPRALYIGGFSHLDNLGDVALFPAYRQLFNRLNFIRYPGGRIAKAHMNLFRPIQIGVLAGGTLINFIKPDIIKECSTTISNLIAFGTGVEDPIFWKRNKNWKDTSKEWVDQLRRFQYIGVRGPFSQKILQEKGVSHVEVIGDPVLAFADNQISSKSENLTSFPHLGLNIGISNGNVWGSEKIISEEFIKLAIKAKQNKWTITWYVVWPEDFEITKECAYRSGTEDRINCFFKDYMGYLDSVKYCTAFVGMKLHSVILAHCKYIPSVMIEYRPKCLDYMSSVNQTNLCFRSDNFTANEIFDKLNVIVNDWHNTRHGLFEYVFALKSKQFNRAQTLQDKFIQHP